MNAPHDFRAMTADTVGKDLLSALLTEIRLMPTVWEKLSKTKQDDIIERIRNRVEGNVKMAVHLMASQGRVTIAAELDQVVRKDGIKAVFKIASTAEGRHDLFDSEGKVCLIVVADSADHTAGMDEIQGESDQRAMDLGHEYDPDGDGKGMEGAFTGQHGEVIDVTPELPSPDDMPPTDAQMKEAYDAGFRAAMDGKTTDDAPVIRYELVAEWLRGFNAWPDDKNNNPA